MKKRVVITGFACINPLGLEQETYWKRSLQGLSATSGIDYLGCMKIPDYMSRVAGIITNFDSTMLMKEDAKHDRSVQLALKATEEAIKMSNMTLLSEERTNVHIATAIGNINLMEKIVEEWGKNEKDILYLKEDNDFLASMFQFNNVADVIADKYKVSGEVSVIATGCTGGVDAVGYSYNRIKYDDADIAITGSTDSPITPLVVSSFSKINATTRRNDEPNKASRPFERDRDGFVLAEGCGIFILESLEHALQRDAPIWGEVVGYGSCSNALHMTDVPEDGIDIAKSMKLALDDAEISFDMLDYVNLHGSSTPQNDLAERNALYLLAPHRYNKIPVTSNKSQIGHALSASNSIEIVSCIKTLQTNIIAPTVNMFNKDPCCDLDVVDKARKVNNIKYILKNSSGFSGIHSAVVLKKWKEEKHDCN